MAFDALHKWLGIPPEQQPPDLYRLLGLRQFEDDIEVIDAAADKQLGYLHAMTSGPHAAAAEELSNQISAARIRLCDPAKRSVYDQSLKRKLAGNQSGSLPGNGTQTMAAGKQKASAAAVLQLGTPVTTGAGWYLHHGDGTTHGPFTLDELTRAAEIGNISTVTQLRHEQVTGNRWIHAHALPEIAGVLPLSVRPSERAQVGPSRAPALASRSAGSPVVVQKTTSRPRPKPVMKVFVTLLLMSLVGGIGFAMQREGSMLGRLVGLTPPAKTESDGSANINASGDSKGAGSDKLADRTPGSGSRGIPSKETKPAKTPEEQVGSRSPAMSSEQDSFGSNGLDKNGLPLMTGPPRGGSGTLPGAFSPEQVREESDRIDLNLSSPRWVRELTSYSAGDRVYLLSIDQSSTPTTMEPLTGEITETQPLKISFDGLQGLGLELRLTDQTKEGAVGIEGQFKVNFETAFRMTNLKRIRKTANEQFNNAQFQVTSQTNETAQLSDIVATQKGRPLAVVGQAKRRLVVLRRTLPEAQRLFTQTQKVAVETNRVFDAVTELDEKAELVISVVKP